ncbi:MAG: sodium/proton-translocating pyrophosphatase, partial [Candidatus Berkiella sp.]
MELNIFILGCAAMALLYGLYAGRQICAAAPGNPRMMEIAAAIQEGAQAYLNRQYLTIGIVGLFVAGFLTFMLGKYVGIGFVIGSVLSGLAGYVGMNVSVRANVRTAEAARSGLAQALDVAFKGGAITGMLVVGLGLFGVTAYFIYLNSIGLAHRPMMEALVALSFGA